MAVSVFRDFSQRYLSFAAGDSNFFLNPATAHTAIRWLAFKAT
jgi:hypothetical protein